MPRKQRKQLTSSGWDFHQHVWRHNSFMGMARMMQVQADTIINSSSASMEAKALARDIWLAAKELDSALRRERIDPK